MRRFWNVPRFFLVSNGCSKQATHDPACLGGALYPGPKLTFWTATLWRDEESLKRYVRSGAHLASMKHLPRWCNEAATGHIEGEALRLPSAAEIPALLRAKPKFFAVKAPSEDHRQKKISPVMPWRRQDFKGEAEA